MQKRTNPFQFFQQVKREASKVTWPTSKETVTSTIMVLILATLATIFFFSLDQILKIGLDFVLGI